jgi:hypothetical protein
MTNAFRERGRGPERSFHQKKTASAVAAIVLTSGWLIGGNADTEPGAGSRGDRTRYVLMMIAHVQ